MLHKGNGSIRQFLEPPRGLYWINTKDSDDAGSTTMLKIYDKYSGQVIPYIDMDLINIVED